LENEEDNMKIAALIARILLGLLFLVMGLNGFFHFLKGPIPPGPAGEFVTAISTTHYWVVIFGVQAIGGLLLLVNRYVPLGLVILGPVIVNILCFHAFMAPQGLPGAVVVAILWTIVALRNKQYLAGILAQKTE
jgi:putative oxidoreductase